MEGEHILCQPLPSIGLTFPSSVRQKLRSDGVSHYAGYWPAFIFQNYTFNPRDPWSGLFRSSLLVMVGSYLIAWGHP